jgi:inositol phosphorylceramide mannosyltransferase catalytic subunit
MSIPKVFHQIWIGPATIPGEFLDFRDQWMKLNPDWAFCVWNDKSIDSWILASDEGNGAPFRNRRIYEQLTVMAQKIDLLAVEIPYAYGGVYLDCDFEPARSLGGILNGVEAFAAWENDYIIAGGFMGCSQGHPVFRDFIDGIPASIKNGVGVGINGVTGPGFRTPIWQKHMRDERVRVFPPEQFYPWYLGSWRKPGTWHDEFPEAYAAHHWAHSWAGAVSPEIKI